MNLELLKYMGRKVRLKKDISHQEYQVLGLNWNTEHIYLAGDRHIYNAHYTQLDLVPENSDDDI